MHTLLNTIDSLFTSNGWNIYKKNEENRCYYKKYYELERFEVQYYPNKCCARLVIPIENASFRVHVSEYKVYDYLYEHLSNNSKNPYIS